VTALVVFAHPCPESFGGAVFAHARTAVEATGEQVETIELYSDGFEPGQQLSSEHRDALGRATSLVLVYPTWWSSQPAILGAWLVRAAEHDIAHLEHVVCVTTHGSGRCANFVIGQAGKLTVRRTFCASCPAAKFRWLAFYGTDTSGARDRAKFLRRVDVELGGRRAVLRRSRMLLRGA
jgi:putative NADPH-quinone reductase